MKFIFKVHMFPGHSVDEYAEGWVRAINSPRPGSPGIARHLHITRPIGA